MNIESILSPIGVTAAILTIPASVELGLLTAASFFRSRHRSPEPSKRLPQIAVVIPAHNERESIGRCLDSLSRCRRIQELAAVFVVADNCTDETAAIARAAGAEVMERNNTRLRGKGHALHFAFERLINRCFDAFLVIDADSEVDRGLIEEFAKAFDRGADAVQCSYQVSDPEKSPRLDLALRAFNVVRPRGRSRLGLSAGILGNGFALWRRVLETVPYTADSIVEDLEYHLNLVTAGVRVEYLETTWVRGAMPVSESGQASQRARWEGGRLGMLRQRGAWLAQQVLCGRMRYSEALLDLLTLPLGFHTLLIAIALALPSTFGRSVGAAGSVVLLMHVMAAIAVGSSVVGDLGTLVRTPGYLYWKLKQLPGIVRASGRSVAWIRTARAGEEALNG